MKYMGGKYRLAKHLLPIILAGRQPDQWYVEPFCGGCNVIDKVTGLRWANDAHPELIALWQALQAGWEPPESISELEYRQIKAEPDHYDLALVGFAGFAASYSGKWWGGYARGKTEKGIARDYVGEDRRALLRQAKLLQGVKFTCSDYRFLELPERSIIYCDPPYQGTTQYSGHFNHESFWQWCREQAQKEHRIFVSEFQAPADFVSIWSQERATSLTRNTGARKAVEHLFIYAGK